MYSTNDKYDADYDIRLAELEDIPKIMKYIDINWKKDHIMSCDRKLFDYEFVHGNEVDFVIAVHRKRKTIEAIFGFLRCSESRKGDIWGSFWHVRDNNQRLLGIELAKRVYTLTGCRSHIGNGANPNTTVPLRKVLFHDQTGKMKQYYWLNPRIKDYRIAEVIEPWNPQKKEGAPSYELVRFDSFEELNRHFDIKKNTGLPYKDSWYFNHRYFMHPYYKYLVYGVSDGNRVQAILVAREQELGGAVVLRIVDFIGEHRWIEGLYDALDHLAELNQYEYIDFFEYGIPESCLECAGFQDRDKYQNIVPNYFEPFVRENIDIWVHFQKAGTTFFKADGDQDRPNGLR